MPCNCAVIVREVWDTRDLIGDVLDGNQLKKGSLSTRFEPEDLNALEMALRIKDEHGGTVTAVSVGEPKETDVLRECMYRGIDQVLRVTADPEALDSAGTADVIAKAINELEDISLVLCGITVVEGENASLGGLLAGKLGWNQVSYVDAVDNLTDSAVTAKRGIEMGYEYIEASFPALFTVGVALVEDDPRTPRSAKAMLKLKAKKAEIPEKEVTAPSAKKVDIADMTAVPEVSVESKEVDPEDSAALKGMLDEVLKGE